MLSSSCNRAPLVSVIGPQTFSPAFFFLIFTLIRAVRAPFPARYVGPAGTSRFCPWFGLVRVGFWVGFWVGFARGVFF